MKCIRFVIIATNEKNDNIMSTVLVLFKNPTLLHILPTTTQKMHTEEDGHGIDQIVIGL